MTFLAPLFLIGGLLIAGPIIAHLVRRSTRDRVRFSDTQFLAPSPPRLQRRSRIENWWLLALRCLVVLVLTAGFARPFFRQEIPLPPASDGPRHMVVVLDDSASMRREGLWADAVARVRAEARELDRNDRFAVLTAGGDVSLLLSSEQWAGTPEPDRTALLDRALEAHAPGWGPTRLDTAIDAALEEVAAMAEGGEPDGGAQLVVVSDTTAGARVAGLAGRHWPPGCTVTIASLAAAPTADASLQWLGWGTSPDGKRLARVRVHEHGGSTLSIRLQLRAADGERELAAAQQLQLAPREARVVLVDVPAELRDPLRLELTGDAEPYNNTLWLVPPQPRELTLPYLGDHAAHDATHALFYLTRALSGWRDPQVRVITGTAAGDISTNASDSPLLVIDGPLTAVQLDNVRARVTAGTFALVLLADAAVVPTVGTLLNESGWAPAPLTRKDALFGQIDFAHPLFTPFADPRFSDFSRVRFWRPVPVTLPPDSRATVVARFDDGAPAVLEAELGRGRVVVWGGDWSNVASQWVLSTKFVPWLQALLERASGGPPRPAIAEVGDANALASTGDVQWQLWGANDNAKGTTAPVAPGFYQLTEGERTRIVAVQVPASESRNDPLPADTWEKLGLPVASAPATTVPPDAARTGNAASDVATESQQKLWRWLLLLAVVLLGVESVAALTAARRAGLATT